MKRIKTILSLMMILALAAGSAFGVLADGTQTVDESGSPAEIPVYLTAEAVTLNVTLPTAFPVVLDPDTAGSRTADNLRIVNNSAGSVRVSEIRVAQAGEWSLADYGEDLRNAVDSMQVGVSVTPSGGQAGAVGTALTTVAGSAASQTLLSGTNPEWILDAVNDGDSDELGILYDTSVAPVTAPVYNGQIASIIITITWNN